MRVAACLVTRGDVPMDDILESIPEEWETVIWDNSVREDLGVYGRYAAIRLTEAEWICVVDDDAVLDRDSFWTLAAEAVPDAIVANMPERFRPHYPDSCLVGFGAIFPRDLPSRAFNHVLQWHNLVANPVPDNFNLVCDVYFTTLSHRILLDLPYRDQPWASDPNRMWKQPGHVPMRSAALEHARRLR